MSLKRSYNRYRFLRPLCVLCYYLGVTYFKDVKRIRLTGENSGKYYKIFIAILIIVGYAISLVGRIILLYGALSPTVILVDAACSTILTMTNVLSTLNGCASRSSALNELFLQFVATGKTIPNHKNVRAEFNFQIIFGHIVMFLFHSFDAYFWVRFLGLRMYAMYIFRIVQDYHCFVFSLLIRHCALSVKDQFETVNELFTGHFVGIYHISTDLKTSDVTSKNRLGIKELCKVYTKLRRQMKLYNDAFGLPVLFLTLYLVCQLLHASIFCTVFYFPKKGINLGSFQTSMCIWCVVWAIKDFMSLLSIISACHGASEKAKETADICYKLLQELPNDNGFVQDKSVREDLSLLAIQSSTRPPTFSAGGFFVVDYTVFFAIISSVTSYLVVLIQFN